jgi:hypothetical protein
MADDRNSNKRDKSGQGGGRTPVRKNGGEQGGAGGKGGHNAPGRKGDDEIMHSPRGTSGAFPEEPNEEIEDGEDGESENDEDVLKELEEEE